MSARVPLQHAGMRASNLALVLGELADAGPQTRTQLAARTGLTKSSVSGLIGDLIGAGLVAESLGPTAPARGRPGSVVAIDRQGAAGLGLEINVDYLAAVVTDLEGTPRYRHVVTRDNRRSDEGGATAVVDALTALAGAAAQAAAEQRLDLAGVCVAVPGTVDHDGTVRSAPNLHWTRVALGELLTERLPQTPLGVAADNEGNLAALGELWFGGQAPDDFVHVSGEIGIGGGVVVGGRLFRGAHGQAGELGHVVVDADGPACSCGGHGCLERLAGQEAITAAAGVPDRDALLAACAAADPRAIGAVRDAGGRLGVALASVVNLIDPTAVVLGGLFADLAPWLRPAVAESLGGRLRTPPAVLASRIGADAAVRGAAGSVVRRVLADPAGYLSLVNGAA